MEFRHFLSSLLRYRCERHFYFLHGCKTLNGESLKVQIIKKKIEILPDCPIFRLDKHSPQPKLRSTEKKCLKR